MIRQHRDPLHVTTLLLPQRVSLTRGPASFVVTRKFLQLQMQKYPLLMSPSQTFFLQDEKILAGNPPAELLTSHWPELGHVAIPEPTTREGNRI